MRILIGDDDVITKENSAVVRLLFKQQFFSFCIPMLVSGFNSATKKSKFFFLEVLL